MLGIKFPREEQTRVETMPSLNHRYLCTQIMRQLLQYPNISIFSESLKNSDKFDWRFLSSQSKTS
jgi:hypothetical protein